LLQAEIIDREDVRQSMTVIKNMTNRVKEGENFIIFAEGTRSRNGNKIGEFKGGSFKSAMNARCPIVPVALIDSYKAFDTNSIKKLTVQIHYMKPLYYEDYKDMKSTEIATIVENKIKETIAQYVHD
jgi:1-acyl-sn-glycerol-3-phosphate acyltransferase